MLSDKPSKMIASFKIFLEVNLIPFAKMLVFLKKWLKIIPMNIAITAEPIKWIGSKLSIKQASAAIPSESNIPGKSLSMRIKILQHILNGNYCSTQKNKSQWRRDTPRHFR
jgi:hypothetical protein